MSKTKKRILSLGLSQSNFLIQLYAEILKIDNSLSFSVNDLKDISSGNVDNNIEVFDGIYQFPDRKFSFFEYLGGVTRLIFKRFIWQIIAFELGQKHSLRSFYFLIKKQVRSKLTVDKNIVPLGFDIYHFHFCIAYTLGLVNYLPKKSQIICSFWGSDLYRNNDKRNLFYVNLALDRATLITIQTPEMSRDLMDKHGEHLSPKIKNAQFALEQKIYDYIDDFREDSDALQTFRSKYDIPSNSTVVTIGYNANQAFNHIEILQNLDNLPNEVKENITLILPLGYSRKGPYLASLQECVDSISGFRVIMLHKFLPHNAIAKLRLITDIQIQLPVSDALSGSVTEVVYAGNYVIAGSWLPYGIYERGNIKLSYIDAIDGINHAIIDYLNNKSTLKSELKKNPTLIPRYFFPEYTSQAWIAYYHSIASESTETGKI